MPEKGFRPEFFIIFKYISVKLPLLQKLHVCYFRGSCFSQCFIPSIALPLHCLLPSQVFMPICIVSDYQTCSVPLKVFYNLKEGLLKSKSITQRNLLRVKRLKSMSITFNIIEIQMLEFGTSKSNSNILVENYFFLKNYCTLE